MVGAAAVIAVRERSVSLFVSLDFGVGDTDRVRTLDLKALCEEVLDRHNDCSLVALAAGDDVVARNPCPDEIFSRGVALKRNYGVPYVVNLAGVARGGKIFVNEVGNQALCRKGGVGVNSAPAVDYGYNLEEAVGVGEVKSFLAKPGAVLLISAVKTRQRVNVGEENLKNHFLHRHTVKALVVVSGCALGKRLVSFGVGVNAQNITVVSYLPVGGVKGVTRGVLVGSHTRLYVGEQVVYKCGVRLKIRGSVVGLLRDLVYQNNL